MTSVGAFGGWHVFSKKNELGVPDRAGPIDVDSVANGPIIGARFGLLFTNWVGVEAEAGFIPTGSRLNDDVGANAVAYRAHLFVELWTDPMAKVIPFLLFGGGATTVVSTDDEDVISKDTDELAYIGAGVKLKNDSGLGVRFDARALFPPSNESTFATSDFEFTIGLFKEFGVRTRDAATPEPEPEPEPGPGDQDGDGILDPDDQCVDQPEDPDGHQDDDGCPDTDDDGDGILDASDDCRMEPEDMDAYSDEDGCPDPDNDGDGILDEPDQCKLEAEDIDQFQDDDGCPDPDNDGDGVLDGADQCPTELETPNSYQDSDGCPDDVPKAVQQFTGVIKGINFKNNEAVILKSSYKVLDKALKVLQDYPATKLEISGHTDDTGTVERNKELSQQRADAVRQYFIDKGIDESRLTAVGYANEKPLVNKKTKAARAKNRRVEFQLIQ